MVIITQIIWVIGILLAASAFHYSIFLLGEFLLGFGSGGYIPIAQAIIGDATPPNKRGETYGISSIIWFFGYFSGILLGSLLSPVWQLALFLTLIPFGIFCLFYGVMGRHYELKIPKNRPFILPGQVGPNGTELIVYSRSGESDIWILGESPVN